MDNQEVREFLRTRRARLTSVEAGIIGGNRRRVTAVRRRTRTTEATVRPSLQRLLDAITGAPAWVANQRTDILATNPLGRALFAPMLDDLANQHNIARFTFLSPASRTFYPDWRKVRTTSWRPSAPPPSGTRTTGPHRSHRRSSPAAMRSGSAGPHILSASTAL
jgi:hypothetical protein